jgi:pyrrolidone-carboxylate peptidase
MMIAMEGQAKTVLLSAFDPFNNALKNNSTIVAKKLMEKFKDSGIKIHYCELPTIYDKASQKLLDCYHELPVKPDVIISLGEGLCHGAKFETRAINRMHSTIPDNDGVLYKKREINPGQNKYQSLNLDFKSFFQHLSKADKRVHRLSKDMGEFVCNQTAYLMMQESLEVPYGFIHVPGQKCRGEKDLIDKTVDVIGEFIHLSAKPLNSL